MLVRWLTEAPKEAPWCGTTFEGGEILDNTEGFNKRKTAEAQDSGSVTAIDCQSSKFDSLSLVGYLGE